MSAFSAKPRCAMCRVNRYIADIEFPVLKYLGSMDTTLRDVTAVIFQSRPCCSVRVIPPHVEIRSIT